MIGSTTAVRNAMQLLELFEEKCGWDPCYREPDVPAWKVKTIEAGKINRKVATKPDSYTWEVLTMTVLYCARERIEVRAPMGLFLHVDKVIIEQKRKQRAAPSDTQVAYEQALEIERGRPDGADWVTRFTRAVGPAREEILAEWRASRT